MSSSQQAANGMNGGNYYDDDAYDNDDTFIDNIDNVGINDSTAHATAVRDDVYCHLTARRAVARAALYLGTIDCMSVEALDTLAGVLLAYLSRIGQTLAACTEASGRSSAHVHVLDCIRAVELCTEAAVQRVHFEGDSSGATETTLASSAAAAAAGTDGTTAGSAAVENAAAGSGAAAGDSARRSTHSRIDPVDQTSWKGLAAFCFGPNWHEPLAASSVSETLNGGDLDGLGGSSHGGSVARRRGSLSNSKHSAAGGGGKVGPSSLLTNTNAEMMLIGGMAQQQQREQNGWDAPYPEDICAWPVVSQQYYATTANPHAMSPFTVDSLHNPRHIATATAADADTTTIMAEEAQQLNEIPDVAFLAPPRTGWGRLLEPGAAEKSAIAASTTATVAATEAAAADSTTTAAAGKRKQAPTAEEEDDSDSLPAKKKAKFNIDDDNDKKTQPTMTDDDDDAGKEEKTRLAITTIGQTAAAAAADDQNRRPFYVPRHFPPFPRPADAVGRTVLDDDTLLGAVQTLQEQQQQQAARKKKNQDGTTGSTGTTGTSRTPSSRGATTRGGGAKVVQKTTGPMVNVRSALVRLGTPWGSGWDKDPTAASDSIGDTNSLPNDNHNHKGAGAVDDINNDADLSSNSKIAVPVGRTEQPRDNDTAGGGGGPAQIVPLNRASGSRVSRILEGSMDAAPVM